MTPKPRRIHFVRNIVLIFGVAVVILLLSLGGYIIKLSADAAKASQTPPRLPLDQTPANAGMPEYEDVSFTTSDGVLLKAWYIAPKAETGMVVLLAHGYAHNRLMLLPEAQVLTQHGYGVLMFDFRGHGESGNAPVTFSDYERRDLEAAIDFAATQPNVKKLGAIGFSMGAATLAQVAVQDQRLNAAVVEAAYPTLDEEIRYRSRIFGPLTQWPAVWVLEQAGVDVAGTRPSDNLCSINPRSLLLIYGDQDMDVPPGTVETMRAAICDPQELWLVAGAGHQNYMEVAPTAYTERLLNFFGQD